MDFKHEMFRAEKLESAGLWRRAARQWLTVLDLLPPSQEKHRAQIIARREECVTLGNMYCGEYSGIAEMRLMAGEEG